MEGASVEVIKNDDVGNHKEEHASFNCSSETPSRENPLLPSCQHSSTSCAPEIVQLKPELGISNNEILAPAEKLTNFEEILNRKDHEGNPVSDIIATSLKQIQILNDLVSGYHPTIASVVEVNATNERGLTALDLHDQGQIGRINRDITSLLNLAATAAGLNGGGGSTASTGGHAANNKMLLDIMLKTVSLTVFTFVAGGSYNTLFNLNSIYPKEDQYYYRTSLGNMSVKDVVMGRAHLPDVFYFLVLNTLTFIASVVVIVANTWSLVPKWSFCYRAAPIIVLGSVCMAYALLVNRIIPKFWITSGSRKIISSFALLWLIDLPFIFFILTLILAFRKFFKL